MTIVLLSKSSNTLYGIRISEYFSFLTTEGLGFKGIRGGGCWFQGIQEVPELNRSKTSLLDPYHMRGGGMRGIKLVDKILKFDFDKINYCGT